MYSGQSWNVWTSGDEVLNFCIYVGCAYGVFESHDRNRYSCWPNQSLLRAEDDLMTIKQNWHQWWTKVVAMKADRVVRKQYPASPALVAPYFTAECPILRACCERAWEPFQQWWYMPAGGQSAIYYWESAPHIPSYISEFEREMGRKSKPFQLQIDLVYTGLNNPIEPAPNYIIFPVGPLLIDKEWWMERLRRMG
ncbi:hypothetical protein ACFO9Q_14070 [Paenibacillus sp. GCM10023252]|uniref:hypothetical protein n=1 Tax=Paenibacillus sp. GCM10023252 TaxID=3252649 RepID=UPI00360CFF5A